MRHSDAGAVVAGVARAMPGAALHPQGFFVTNRALELCEPGDVLPLARALAPLGPELATDPRGVHHLSKLTDLLVRPSARGVGFRVMWTELTLTRARAGHQPARRGPPVQAHRPARAPAI